MTADNIGESGEIWVTSRFSLYLKTYYYSLFLHIPFTNYTLKYHKTIVVSWLTFCQGCISPSNNYFEISEYLMFHLIL